jgi:hypothetical protein
MHPGWSSLINRQLTILSYAHFVTIAKEIGLLENDMLELKEMLTEWKRAPSLLGAGTGTGDDAFGGYEVGKSSGNVCEYAWGV